MNNCRRYLVSGRVQGVNYRAATQEQALALDLTGWVRNLRDGRVELVACGTDDKLARLENWLWRGPRFADVTGVETSDTGTPGIDTFEVRY